MEKCSEVKNGKKNRRKISSSIMPRWKIRGDDHFQTETYNRKFCIRKEHVQQILSKSDECKSLKKYERDTHYYSSVAPKSKMRCNDYFRTKIYKSELWTNHAPQVSSKKGFGEKLFKIREEKFWKKIKDVRWKTCAWAKNGRFKSIIISDLKGILTCGL